MKQPIHLLFILLIICFIMGCEDSPEVVVLEEIKSFGYVTDVTERITCLSLEYDKEYTASLKVHNDQEVKLQYILIYKHYEGALGESERVLVEKRGLDVWETDPYDIYVHFNTKDLKLGLSIGNTQLPQNDTELSLGDVFILSYEYLHADGSIEDSSQETTVEIVPRLDGWFVTEDSFSGFGFGAFDDMNIKIRAVSMSGYIVESVGPFTIDNDIDNWVYFYVDDDNMVHIPLEYEGEVKTVWGEDPILSPETHPEYFNYYSSNNIPNQVYNDDGVYRIRFNLGYYRESGFREFEQILRKSE